MRSLSASFLALLACLGSASLSLAAGGSARITLLDGSIHRGVQVTSIDGSRIAWNKKGGGSAKAPIDELVNVVWPGTPLAPTSPPPQMVSLELRNGDRIVGSLLPGKEDRILLSSPLLGPLSFRVEDASGVRFLKTFSSSGRPAHVSDSEKDRDLFVYKNHDHLSAVFLQVGSDAVIVHGHDGKDFSIPFSDLMEIRFASGPPAKSENERVFVLQLADTSRLTLETLSFDGRFLEGKTARGATVKARPGDVLAVYQQGGRFVYLSDVQPAKIKVVPWIGDAYAWDRPHFDESFLGKPLTVGGETYMKGIGVISGTSITYDLDGTYKWFQSLIALDDSGGSEGDVTFEVLLDGKKVYQSPVMRLLDKGAAPTAIPRIDLTGAKKLTLHVGYVDDWVKDFADFIEPMLVKK